VAPTVSNFIVPLTLGILSLLFLLQKYGTSVIGALFGPVMLAWFSVIAAGGAFRVWQHPAILICLSPLTAVGFVASHPGVAFVATGAVVLVITGAEALYADMGHFGRLPISRAWFLVVFPALLLCYMGQGALMLDNPATALNPFLQLFPAIARVPVVLLATAAALIASQSVISGAFSLTRQAIQLNFLPKMLIRHTSDRQSGQIYMPLINMMLYLAVVFLVLFFGSSVRLAGAYGVAVSGTLAVDTLLYLYVMRTILQRPIAAIVVLGAGFVAIDAAFIASTVPKILTGGWLPVIIAIVAFTLIDTWRTGELITSVERKNAEGPLQVYIDKIHGDMSHIERVPGQAVYIGHHPGFAPLALHESVEENHELHEKVVIVSVRVANRAHVAVSERAQIDELKYDDGISYLSLDYGYHDVINIPKDIGSLRSISPDLDFDPRKAAYFISMHKVIRTKRRNLAGWRKFLFTFMDRNAVSASDYYKLPLDRTTEVSSMLKL
jgi:KUP system potassium uptake protein